jgi:hypothetical protein
MHAPRLAPDRSVQLETPVQFDRAKLKTVILYTCAKCEPMKPGIVKLHRVLYYADMLHYAFVGAPITGATYRKRSFGPACDDLLSTLRELRNEGAIDIRESEYFGYRRKEYVTRCHPEIDRLSVDALALLNDVIDFVCSNDTAKPIGDYSLDRPWEMAEFGDELPYHSAFHLFPTQVSEEAMEWASGEIDKCGMGNVRDGAVGGTTFRAFRSRVLEARRQ